MLGSTAGLMGVRVLGGQEPRSPCGSASFAACIELQSLHACASVPQGTA